MRRACVLLAALVALPLLSIPLQAQSVAVGKSLTVNLPPATGGGVRGLTFGSINPGGSSDTGAGAEGNASAAKWQFTTLQKNATYTLTFTLPASLVNGSTLPITWPAGYGRWCSYRATETCAGGTAFNPSAGTFSVTATTTAGAGNNDRVLDIWLGGQLSVPENAIAGLYSGTLSLTVTGPGL